LRQGLVKRNVAALARAPKVERREVVPLNTTQARAFLDAVEGHRLESLFAVAVGCGLREGECLGLEWSDIDFEARAITVRQQLRRI
jgi:integrase